MLMTDGTKELLNAIRAKCLECSCGSRKEVERCAFKNCALYPYRTPEKAQTCRTRETKLRGQTTMEI